MTVVASDQVLSWAEQIRPHLTQTVESILAAGRELIAAKEALPHGQFGPLLDELGLSPSWAAKFMRIAANPVLANVSPGTTLPASISTLDELTRWEPEELAEAIDAGDITPATTRAEAQAKRSFLTLAAYDGTTVQYPKPKAPAKFNESTGDGISWASWSWNPITGCLHACEYCYAREIATSPRYAEFYPAGFTPVFHHERLAAPANTTIPTAHQHDPAYRRVFVCSMADLYGKWVPDGWISAVHDSMLASPEWEYLLLTKFPSRYAKVDLPPNAWVGTSVDEQRRVPIAEEAFRKIDGVKVKWLSLEPLRTPLQFSDLSMFDWVVIGAQTGTNQPTGRVDSFAPDFGWVSDIYQQAREAGCRVHFKPNLLRNPGMRMPDEYPNGEDRGPSHA